MTLASSFDVSIDRHRPPVRADLAQAHRDAWTAIARPGTWLSGARRLAVAAEIRHARESCAHCRALKAALSPNAVTGAHSTLGVIAPLEVELVHRVVNDSGRITKQWSDDIVARGLHEGTYVEITGLCAMVMMLDACTRGLGLADNPLPAPQPGEPTRYRPPGARVGAAWRSIVEPEDVAETDGPMYPSPKAGYIYRGLSLVPQSMRDYWALANTHYLPGAVIYKFDQSIRAISRPQTEIIAARVSALHQCAY